VTNTWKATNALALVLGLAYSMPAFSETQVGVNFTTGERLSSSAQTAALTNMQASGVRVIRLPLELWNGSYAASVATIEAAYARGIRVIAILTLSDPATMQSGAVPRPANPALGTTWAEYGLTQLSPMNFAAVIEPVLKQLDSAGVVLAGIELGNEINWTLFNGDFPTPGQGRVFGNADMVSNPEAIKIAQGFATYEQVFAQLADIRSTLSLNYMTPLISAGLADPGAPASRAGLDAVAINTTLDTLRSDGLDTIANFYGIHFYLSATATPAARLANLQGNALTQCGTTGIPCWVTEWGFQLPAGWSCPASDGTREQLAEEIRSDVALYWGNLVPLMTWFDWLSPSFGIWQCGSLTGTGYIVLE
jgi:hypothetical protein